MAKDDVKVTKAFEEGEWQGKPSVVINNPSGFQPFSFQKGKAKLLLSVMDNPAFRKLVAKVAGEEVAEKPAPKAKRTKSAKPKADEFAAEVA